MRGSVCERGRVCVCERESQVVADEEQQVEMEKVKVSAKREA